MWKSKRQSNDSSLKPGGTRGAPMDVGMSSLDPDSIGNPSAAREKAPHDENPAAPQKTQEVAREWAMRAQ